MKYSFFYKVTGFLSMLIFFALVFISFAQEGTDSGKNLFLDFDQDGLSNEEELAYGTDPYASDTDKDGYSDYTEVSGGYDPKKPAPGDKLIKEVEKVVDISNEVNQESNLTEVAATQLVDMMSDTVSDGGVVTLAEVEKVVKDSIEKSAQVPELSEIDVDRIQIQDQSYKKLSDEEKKEQVKKDAREYVTAVSYIFMAQFPQLVIKENEDPTIATEKMISDIMTSFSSGNYKQLDELSESGKRAVEQLFDVKVPEVFADVHIRGIQLANYVQEMKDKAKIQTEDPLESIANISLAQGFIISAQEFFTDIENRLNEIGLDNSIISLSE